MNRLSGETSPYLLQHAENPVDWHPWDEEALALAKRENKPILLSIGYAACHWCHVMARESFESEAVARVLNEHFVSIKVDREERPDLDRIYQAAHRVLARQGGGWPLNVFLDPADLLPFFSGTYFPPQAGKGQPGFREVLKGIGKAFGEKNDKKAEFKAQLKSALQDILGGGEPGEVDPTLFDRACGQIDSSFDAKHGGFSDSPKFPHPAGLELLLDAATSAAPEKSARACEMLDFTLEAMARGGLFDHLGGGFFRYCVDADWSIPHFEKMLYDNGLLLSLYARRARHTGVPLFRDAANRTADWLMREMQIESGGFCASLDADTGGEEGAFYAWTDLEANDVAGEDYDALAERYGFDGKANFGKKWHLRLAPPVPGADPHDAEPAPPLAEARQRLLERRDTRERPGRDDKILTAWNALAIRGLADAGRELDRGDCLLAATRALDYLKATHWTGTHLLATSRNGEARLNGYLDDHAFLLEAVLALLSARWRDGDLAFAMALADAMLARFEDRENGGFFFTSDDHEKLIQRTKSFADDSLPAGNAVAARALMELGWLTGEARYLDAAERTLRAGMSAADRWPSAHATLVRALLDYTDPPPRVVLRCAEAADAAPWLLEARERLSARQRSYLVPADAVDLPGLLASRGAHDGVPVTAYLCVGQQCREPAESLGDFKAATAP